ncbi:hypothetical protein [Aquimarina sediminis]|uniref:hypothetical protein n=1 Tax=Aquimarina sediminis TaxID=2070536 RepID=UPI000CA07D94|nr:hypothetical protein [Aquimarina sediminis]
MNKKEEELLSMHYQMEKTDIKQQRLEDRLMFISEDLKRSKNIRNFYFIFIIVLMLLLAVGSFYIVMDKDNEGAAATEKKTDQIDRLLVANDSLQQEIIKLKTNILEYQNQKFSKTLDSIDGTTHGVIGDDKKDGGIGNMNIPKRANEDKKDLKFERQYCYINKVYQSNDVVFIEADYIQYYQGKKAVRKAKEYGNAEYDIDKKGDTLYFLYNNYYIHNQSSRLRVLELDDKAKVRIGNINQISYGFPLKAFQKVISDKPVLVLEINNGIVYKITEQKLP